MAFLYCWWHFCTAGDAGDGICDSVNGGGGMDGDDILHFFPTGLLYLAFLHMIKQA